MKRYKALLFTLPVFFVTVAVQAQQRTPYPQGQSQPDPPQEGRRGRTQIPGSELNQLRTELVQIAGGAWWNNQNLIARLGITEDQKAKLDRAFENHRQKLVSNTELLDKEEAQLARLLEAEPIDRNAILGQTDRVIQARDELERVNSAMTLEMREALTRAQWMQVPQPNLRQRSVIYTVTPTNGVERGGGPGPRTGGRGGGQRQQ